jgi:hypothetical protein
MQHGLVTANAYWTQINDTFFEYGAGDAVNVAQGNAMSIHNTVANYAGRGIVFDGAASDVVGIHTEQVAEDLTIFASDACTFGPGYFEDVSATDGTGKYAVRLGYVNNGVKVLSSTFIGLRVGSTRPNKKAFRFWDVATATFIGCRNYSHGMDADTVSYGIWIGGDFSTFSSGGTWDNWLKLAQDGGLHVHEGQPGLGWYDSTDTEKWRLYKLAGNSNFFLRDMVNSRMQAQFTPGSTNAFATTALNSRVVVGGALVQSRVVVTYGATNAVAADSGTEFVVTPTNGTAFTISNPTNGAAGQRITIRIVNTFGVLGALDPLGVDVSCYPDLDPLGTLVSGNTALAQAIARRLTTPRGGLFYDTNYGTDLRLYLNEGMTNEAQSRIKAAIESECAKDERVSRPPPTSSFNSPRSRSPSPSPRPGSERARSRSSLAVTKLTVSTCSRSPDTMALTLAQLVAPQPVATWRSSARRPAGPRHRRARRHRRRRRPVRDRLASRSPGRRRPRTRRSSSRSSPPASSAPASSSTASTAARPSAATSPSRPARRTSSARPASRSPSRGPDGGGTSFAGRRHLHLRAEHAGARRHLVAVGRRVPDARGDRGGGARRLRHDAVDGRSERLSAGLAEPDARWGSRPRRRTRGSTCSARTRTA